jgi:hypothetical protein
MLSIAKQFFPSSVALGSFQRGYTRDAAFKPTSSIAMRSRALSIFSGPHLPYSEPYNRNRKLIPQ